MGDHIWKEHFEQNNINLDSNAEIHQNNAKRKGNKLIQLDSPRMNSSRLRNGAISRSFNGILTPQPLTLCQCLKTLFACFINS